MTTKTETLASAMASAFAEIEAATKSANNPHFRSKYADLTSVIEAIKGPLIKHGLFFTQECRPADDGVSVETVLRHAQGETISLGTLYLPANKRDPQGFGSALSYCRRYALLTAFGVPTEDDDGNAATKSVANDSNGSTGLKTALKDSLAQTPKRDLPFPSGPAKNRTELKTLARAFWSDVEGCGDEDQLDILIEANKALYAQIQGDLPSWIDGYTKDGEQYPGLDEVIRNKRTECKANAAWQSSPIAAG